jgi:hypothetical protein
MVKNVFFFAFPGVFKEQEPCGSQIFEPKIAYFSNHDTIAVICILDTEPTHLQQFAKIFK